MTSYIWSNATFLLNQRYQVTIPELELKRDDLLVLIGGNGSGKTSLAKAIAGQVPLLEGTAPQEIRAQVVSFEEQMALFEKDYNLRNSDATTAKEELGLTPEDLLADCAPDYLEEVLEGMQLKELIHKPLRQLSGGEGRKVLLARALCSRPELLVLDCPYDALDVKTRARLSELLDSIHLHYHTPIVLIVNRPEEIPSTVTAMGLITKGSLGKISSREMLLHDPDAQALLLTKTLPDLTLPKPPAKCALLPLKEGPLVRLSHLNLSYEREIFHDLNLTINPGEHWQILGPNGAGKSTLISFITGDNPLVYTQDVTVFGFRRGSGESIWDIKKYFGLVSGSLHLDYRVSAPVINVVLSGFYDSIGLYSQPGDEEIAIAREWLKLAKISDETTSFKALSFGQQRLLLIIRALVKNPPLLILDEPLQGLDGFARTLVKAFISYIMQHGQTSVLFVSHHKEDLPEGFTHRLSFVPSGEGQQYRIVQERLK
ncbi:MAG: molybdate ABC transporter ATP-binding protein ModF [Succinivibrio sp.]|nr:molybdate ABC transporter ATP-binding protein ModF [Succinivibrio sp.]